MIISSLLKQETFFSIASIASVAVLTGWTPSGLAPLKSPSSEAINMLLNFYPQDNSLLGSMPSFSSLNTSHDQFGRGDVEGLALSLNLIHHWLSASGLGEQSYLWNSQHSHCPSRSSSLRNRITPEDYQSNSFAISLN